MEESKAESSGAKDGAQLGTSKDPSRQNETKPQDAGDIKIKKSVCRKHSKGHKRPKKSREKDKVSSESSSSSSSESSSSDSSETESEESESSSSSSSSEEDAEAVRKRKMKARKARKLKAKKKAKSRKRKESTEEDSDSSSSEESSSEEESKKKRSKSRKKRRSKKSRKDDDDSDSDDEEDNDGVARARAQLNNISLRRRGLKGGRTQLDDKSLKKVLSGKGKGRGKKKKRQVLKNLFQAFWCRSPANDSYSRGSKVDFVRVDQLWDSTIHNYKLTETTEDADADEYDQYVFTVRRKFDWENKYTDTVVDIKSKPLKETLNHVMGAVKGISFAEETPIIDPNMLFLYLEELRTYMKELKSQSKSERKKKARKTAATKATHLRVLVKYLDKDYAETKKTLYPLLESNTITFDLLWALFKSNEIAYCHTYSNPDEPRAFKIEYATKVRTVAPHVYVHC